MGREEERTTKVVRLIRDTENFGSALKMMNRKITTFARNSFFHVPGFSVEDMEQELLQVLWLAVQSYDPVKGSTFNSFAQQCFRNRIGSLRREVTSQKRSAEIVSLDVEAVQTALEARRSLPSAEDRVMDRETLREEWDGLSDRLRIRAVG